MSLTRRAPAKDLFAHCSQDDETRELHMPTSFYRYISSPAEVKQINDDRKVLSVNAQTGFTTWYTPTRYTNLGQATQELSLPQQPTHMIGGLSDVIMPSFHIALRVVQPNFGQPGGGVEAATQNPVWLLGLWDYVGSAWIL